MTQMDPYQRGHRDGIRWAITWLHAQADQMNDPKAKSILNDAAFHMGGDTSEKVKRMRQPSSIKTGRASKSAAAER